jgi:phosphoribosylaminoimidazole carboxylase
LEAFGAKECSALRCFSWIPVIPLPILRLQQLTRHAGALVVNEIAPRPHNSGHYTIEACPTFSQYKSQLLSILGFMPRFPNSVIPAMFPATIMLNILGGASKDSHNQLMKRAIAIPNAALHMYGKESKPARKIGHITVVANSMSEGISSFPSATNVCKTLVFH